MTARQKWEGRKEHEARKAALATKLSESLLKRNANSTSSVGEQGTNEDAPKHPSPPGKPQIPTRCGQAGIRLLRDTEDTFSVPSEEMRDLVDTILHAAETRERTVVLHWPGTLTRLSLAHALATLERWPAGDKRGLRSLIYPAKSNSFDVLNHVTLHRDDVLRWANELVESPGQPNRLVIRSLPDKDAFLFSLAELKKLEGPELHPTISELLPRFSEGKSFRHWTSCEERLLAHSAAKMSRRLARAVKRMHCASLGQPEVAPDAAFALRYDTPLGKVEDALRALVKVGPPDVVLVDVTRPTRRALGDDWAKTISAFVVAVHRIFKDARPGMVLVADEPQVAEHIKSACIEACLACLDKSQRRLTKSSFDVHPVPCYVSGEGLTRAPAFKRRPPSERQVHVRASDSNAARVIEVLQKYAKDCPGGRAAAVEAVEAANFIHRLSVLPAGIQHLMAWIDENGNGDTTLRDRFNWVHYRNGVDSLIRRVGTGRHSQELAEALKLADGLWMNYQRKTAFAEQLADAVGAASRGSERVAVVFDRPLRLGMARRFFDEYENFPAGNRFSEFRQKVRLVLHNELSAVLDDEWATSVVFAGLDEVNLRTVVVDERLPQKCVVLLNHRSARYLRGVLERISAYEAFKCFSPRLDFMRAQLSGVQSLDGKLILRMGDFAPPDFNYQSIIDAGRSNEGGQYTPVEIEVENGATIHRHPGCEVFVYDPTSPYATERGFHRIQLDTLRVGDRLFDMSPDLRERMETALRDAGVPIQRDRRFEASLRKYHEVINESVHTQFPNRSLSDAAREVMARMAQENPSIKTWAKLGAVRDWINHERSASVDFSHLQPQAPMKQEHYFALCKALRMNDVLARYFMHQVIAPIRNARRLDGRYVADTYSHMLLEPESVIVHAGLSRSVVEDLFARAMDNIYTVESIRRPAVSQEAAP